MTKIRALSISIDAVVRCNEFIHVDVNDVTVTAVDVDDDGVTCE